MRKIENNQLKQIVGGDVIDRLTKQIYKCQNGSMRACRRAMRMSARHLYKF